MSWKNAKFVLIITYSVILAMFAATFAFFVVRAYIQDVKTVNAVNSILEKNNIHMAEDIDLHKKYKTHSFSLDNISYDKEVLAERILGNDYTKVDDNQYKNEKKQLRVTGSRILYENNKKRELIKGSIDVDKQLNEFLVSLGFKDKTFAVYNTTLNSGIISFQAVPKYNDYWIRGTGIKGSADRNGIFYLEGTWFEPTNDNAEKLSFCEITSALVNLIYSDDAKGKTIDKIYANYYIEEKYSLSESVIPVPVYTFKCTDGSEYKINANTATTYIDN